MQIKTGGDGVELSSIVNAWPAVLRYVLGALVYTQKATRCMHTLKRNAYTKLVIVKEVRTLLREPFFDFVGK